MNFGRNKQQEQRKERDVLRWHFAFTLVEAFERKGMLHLGLSFRLFLRKVFPTMFSSNLQNGGPNKRSEESCSLPSWMFFHTALFPKVGISFFQPHLRARASAFPSFTQLKLHLLAPHHPFFFCFVPTHISKLNKPTLNWNLINRQRETLLHTHIVPIFFVLRQRDRGVRWQKIHVAAIK